MIQGVARFRPIGQYHMITQRRAGRRLRDGAFLALLCVLGEPTTNGQSDPLSRAALFPNKLTVLRPQDRGLPAKSIEFENTSGVKLRGWLCDSPHSNRTVLVCMGNSGNSSYMIDYAEFLHAAGFDVMLFDYQGFGRSDGQASIFSLMGDGLAAFDFLLRTEGRSASDVAVLGISLGSTIALRVAAVREVAAVAVEDVYIPADQMRAFAGNSADQPLTKAALTLAERVLLPLADPIANAARLRTPALFIHGELDWLLPPRATTVVSAACRSPHRVWFMPGVGHAPESLEVNDREFRSQITEFFREAFETRSVSDPNTSFEVKADGATYRLSLTVENPKPAAVQLTLVDDAGRFQFERRWLAAGRSTLELTCPFAVSSVSAVTIHHVRRLEPDGWVEALSPLSKALQEFKAVLFRVQSLLAAAAPGGNRLPRARWDEVRKLIPDPRDVHHRVQPRYARLLGELSKLATADQDVATEAAIVAESFLQGDLAGYYELGNASFRLGLQSQPLADACYRAAHEQLRRNNRSAARSAFNHYLTVLPAGETSRISREEIERLTGDSNR